MKKYLLMLAAAAPLLVACGTGSVSESDVELQDQEDDFEESLGSVDKVECPEDLKAEKDATMSCTATVEGTGDRHQADGDQESRTAPPSGKIDLDDE